MTLSKKSNAELKDSDFADQVLSTARSFHVPFFDAAIAAEYTRNVMANGPRAYVLDAFLRLAAKAMPKPSEVIQRAKELAGEKKRFAPVERFLVYRYTAMSTDREYEALRKLELCSDARSALRVGETYVDEITVGGDAYFRWRSESEALPPSEKQKAHNAEKRFRRALEVFAQTHTLSGSAEEAVRMSISEEAELVNAIEHEPLEESDKAHNLRQSG